MTHAGNIEAGIYIISQYLQSYGEPELALMAYNCGPGGARKLWGCRYIPDRLLPQGYDRF